MAASVDFQKITHQEVVVKIAGVTGESGTITLASDLFPQGAVELAAVGTIATDGSDEVDGTNTLFTDEMVNGKIYNGTTGAYIGTVASVESATSLTLIDNAVGSNYSGVFGISYSMQELDEDHDPAVSILEAVYTGSGIATITRDSEVIMTLNAGAANGKIDLKTEMVPDTTKSLKDIVVTFTGGVSAPTQVWLKLRKLGGWLTRIETAYYGAHDDETKAGA